MIFLATHIGVWLLAAFAFGLVIGWFLWGRWIGIDVNRNFTRSSKGGDSPAGSISVLSDSLLKTQRELELCQQRLSDTKFQLGAFEGEMPALAENTYEEESSFDYSSMNGVVERDDLKKIHGIGPVIERKLAELDITSYRQIALLNEEAMAIVGEHINYLPGRIERDGWQQSARELYREKYGEDIF